MHGRPRSAVYDCAYHQAGVSSALSLRSPSVWVLPAAVAVAPAMAAPAQGGRAFAGGFLDGGLVQSLHGGDDALLASVFVGLTLFATVVALLHMAGRRRMQQREAMLMAELNDTRAKLDRTETFLAAEPQVVIAWGLRSNEPEIAGDISLVTDVPIPRRVLGFGSWLPPDQAQALDAQRDDGFASAARPFAWW